MSLFSSLFVGLSGMRVNENAIAVIGDNLANMNTVGFKASRSVFADVLSRTVLGLAGITHVGQGATVSSVERLHTQGALLGTGISTDVAIAGEGYFLLEGRAAGGEGTFYSRNGQFHLDATGHLVSTENLRVQGYQADANGEIGTFLGDLRVEPLQSAPEATTALGLDLNLSAGAALGGSLGGLDDPQADPPGDPPTGQFSTEVTVFDAEGKAHAVDIYFAQTDTDGTFAWRAVVRSDELDGGDGSFYTVVAEGELTFTEGAMTEQTGVDPVELTFAGLGAQELVFDFTGTSSFDGDHAVQAVDADGRAAGDFQFLTILDDGTVLGTYDNGDERALGRMALGTFRNPVGLDGLGGHLYRATGASGDAAVGQADDGGRGSLFAGSLEQSSVDLSQEFAEMIVAQRGFQASSRTVTTADALLSEVVNLKR